MNREEYNKYMREWNSKHRKQVRAGCRAYSLSKRTIVLSYKNRPCTDCYGWFNHWQMQFDHVRSTKKFSIGRHWATTTRKLIKEIRKCEVVCANCHAERTYKRWHPKSKV